RVNPGTPAGTAISNQAVVSSAGLPNLLTDSSGNPATPPQPTVVVVGSGQQVSISAQVSVVGGGPALPGAQLEYLLNIVNSGAVPAYNVVITDDLNGTRPGQLAYVNLSGTVNGSATGVSFAGSTITVDYGALNGPLAPGAVVVLKFRATLNASLALGTVVTNTGVAAWGNPTQTTRASVSIAVGSILSPGAPGGPGTPVLAVHERTAADQRHCRAVRSQSAGPEPGDSSERRHLQLDGAYTGCRGDTHPAECPQRLALAGELLRRCGPAGADHARRRLLQVR